MTTQSTLHLDTTNFEETIQSSTPTLIDFWAPWCGPCQALGPTIDSIATDLQGQVQVGKVNIDDHEALAIKYGIASIPTVLIFKDGQVTDTLVGIRSRQDYERALLG